MRSVGLVGKKYGQLLQSLGLVNGEEVSRALVEQERTGDNLDTILMRNGIVKAEDIQKAIRDSFGVESVDVSKVEIPQEVLSLVPVRFVYRYNLLPIGLTDDGIKVATADPLNYHAFDDLRLLLKREIIPVLGLSKDIQDGIKQYYGIGAETIESMMAAEEIPEGGFKEEMEGEELTEDATIIKFVNQIITEAVNDRATDIHIEPFENELRVRYRIDGILYEAAVPPTIAHYQSAVISRIKIMADMNIAEKRLPQDGKIPLTINNAAFDLRVSTVPTSFGESIAIRLLNRSSTLLDLTDLGMDGEALARFNFLIQKPHGIIFVTGPTGSGKTTTLYAALAKLNKTDVKIITTEDPIEYDLHGVTQIQIHPKIGLTFASVLRSLLRHDPDIMLVGETRDFETAEITIRAALTGHLVFSTLHTNDAAGAISRLLDMGIEPYLIASSVVGFMAQRLVRMICPHCKEEYTPSVSEAAAMRLSDDQIRTTAVYRGRGCEHCKFTGYRGRSGLFEIFPMTEKIRELAVQRASAGVIKDEAIKEGMSTLRQFGWNLVYQGKTTVDEVIRVAQEDEDYHAATARALLDVREGVSE